MSLVVEILSRVCGQRVEPEEYVEVAIDVALGHDVSSQIAIDVMTQISDYIWDRNKMIICMDHFVPAPNAHTANQQKFYREWAKKQDVQFFDCGRGVCHQVAFEEKIVRPGNIIVGADSHTCTNGAVGCLSISIGSTELGVVMATGKLWLMVPKTIMIRLEGELPANVFSKDLAMHILRELSSHNPDYKSVEFTGAGVKTLTLSDRLTICNMIAESGAKTAIFDADETACAYFNIENSGIIHSDGRAECYLTVNLNEVEPLIAVPFSPLNIQTLRSQCGLKVHQAYLGSCTNGRLEDLRVAADVLRGKTIHEDVRLLVNPASKKVFEQAISEGIIQDLVSAGAQITGWSCGACFGGHLGLLGDGERCISSTNRNFPGRMGAVGSEVYLASPATVAASALMGRIADLKEGKG